eukprot:TRINITY_DN8303_c0_g1_i1.p1 TRINITY_DN8303_c0_g1~~TRINITY_DN8303_c0_g1_i1.p1  ORF type:complete len:92 (+),score=5.04 TRINITY_DN8303_c0_g1_i1:139-414(+)
MAVKLQKIEAKGVTKATRTHCHPLSHTHFHGTQNFVPDSELKIRYLLHPLVNRIVISLRKRVYNLVPCLVVLSLKWIVPGVKGEKIVLVTY